MSPTAEQRVCTSSGPIDHRWNPARPEEHDERLSASSNDSLRHRGSGGRLMGWFSSGPRSFPVTSYGYQPLPNATAHGWVCVDQNCRASVHMTERGWTERDVLRRWPQVCDQCGSAADPTLDPPWDHQAEGVELQWSLRNLPDEFGITARRWLEWQLTDAYQAGDVARARHHQAELLEAARRKTDVSPGYELFRGVWEAVGAGDLESAAMLLTYWVSATDTTDVETNNSNRTNARQVMDLASRFFGVPGAASHPSAAAIREGCLTIAQDAFPVLMPDQQNFITQLARG
jgi:hypothetical protein